MKLLLAIRTLITHSGEQLTILKLELKDYKDSQLGRILNPQEGEANGTLRFAYLKHRNVSDRKKSMIKQTVRMSYYLVQPTRSSLGAK